MERALLISAMIKGRPTKAKPSRINFRNELGLRRSHDEEVESVPLSCLASARAIIFYPDFSWKDPLPVLCWLFPPKCRACNNAWKGIPGCGGNSSAHRRRF